MKVLCWFETETVPPSQRSKRQQKKVLREQVAMRARNMLYFCDITKAEAFGKLLWATGCTVNADLCPDLIFLGDGAVWIWTWSPNTIPMPLKSWTGIMLQNISKLWLPPHFLT